MLSEWGDRAPFFSPSRLPHVNKTSATEQPVYKFAVSSARYPFDTDRYPNDCVTLLKFKKLPMQAHDVGDKASASERARPRDRIRPLTITAAA